MKQQRETIESVINKFEQNWPVVAEQLNGFFLKMHRVDECIQEEIEDHLHKLGLQKADFSLLSALRRSAPPYQLTPTELTESMVFSSGGLTKVLLRMEAREYIKRQKNTEDKRSRLVRLTNKGKDLVEKTMLEIQQLERNLCPLNSQEVSQLENLMNKILERVENGLACK